MAALDRHPRLGRRLSLKTNNIAYALINSIESNNNGIANTRKCVQYIERNEIPRRRLFHGEGEKKDCRKTAKIKDLRRIDTRKNRLKILPVKHSIDRK